ncbi:MAG: hypothetical protein KDK36_03700 [Leptospiraceae bacterium]|nr:hypothetical protein [Leptospiraceae bacterium]
MVIKSLEYPVYHRKRRGGLTGEVHKMKGISKVESIKTFEEYLTEAFQGEKVQDGMWFSPNVSGLMKSNLKKI